MIHSHLTSFQPCRVSIVDDIEYERQLIKYVLAKTGMFSCVGSYSSGDEALYIIPGSDAQVVLMDIRMPGMSGIECTKRLKAIQPGLVIIIVTGLDDPNSISEGIYAGGDGYLNKPFTVGQCLGTIQYSMRNACARQPTVQPIPFPPCAPLLSGLEQEIMELMSGGLLNKEIADRLRISVFSLQNHIHKIFAKLNVSNRTEATGRWWELQQKRK